jgi:dTDP-4-amino-4,6-dideoxygalactose transaminase
MYKLSVPDISEQDCAALTDVLKSGNLVYGSSGRKFEEALAEYIGVKHALLVSSGTAALHLSLLALGVGRGDAVIVPDFTFPATANVVEMTGAEVLLADVDRSTYNIDPLTIRKLIDKHGKNKRIKAIMPVHEFGCPANLDEIYAIARENGLEVIEDAACAFGTQYNKRKIGIMGNLCCFSFHPRKALTTGEGGFISTNNDEYAEKIKALRNHGIEYTELGPRFIMAGYNYRMTDFQAALGLSQLQRFDSWLASRRQLYKKYHEILGNCSLLSLPEDVPGHSWQTYMVVLDASIDRTRLIKSLREQDIETNIGAHALHIQPYYADKYQGVFSQDSLENSEILYTRGLALPFHQKMTEQDMQFVAEKLLAEINKQL